MNQTVKNSIVAWAVFSLTVFSSYVGYAAISSVWTDTSTLEASSGGTLTSANWNKFVGNVQQLKDSSTSPGSVASIRAVQTRTQATYTTPISGNGVEITPLNITLTPKKAGNMVILEWNFHGEAYNDNVYLVTRNGVLLPNATDVWNNRWAGITTPDYEGDASSTPNEKVIRIIDFNSLDTASTYALTMRWSAWTAYAFSLNRAVSYAWQDSYESGLSTVIATEVYQ